MLYEVITPDPPHPAEAVGLRGLLGREGFDGVGGVVGLHHHRAVEQALHALDAEGLAERQQVSYNFV